MSWAAQRRFSKGAAIGRVMLALAAAWAFTHMAGFARASGELGEQPFRVLFVGNSYTNFNLLPVLMRRIAASGSHPVPMEVHSVSKPGFTMRRHWKRRRALARIRSGQFTHVVLQAHSLDPIERPHEFEEYVVRFKQAADAAGAQTVLYQTWARHPSASLYRFHPRLRSPDAMHGILAAAYGRLSAQLQARLAPVGTAWRRSLRTYPQMRLHRPDGSHPNWAGTYLAACVIYGAIAGHNPEETTYWPVEVGRERAVLLRSMAAEVLMKPYQGNEQFVSSAEY